MIHRSLVHLAKHDDTNAPGGSSWLASFAFGAGHGSTIEEAEAEADRTLPTLIGHDGPLPGGTLISARLIAFDVWFDAESDLLAALAEFFRWDASPSTGQAETGSTATHPTHSTAGSLTGRTTAPDAHQPVCRAAST